MSLSWWKRLEIRLITFRVAYMNNKQTWSLADSCCQFEAKFRTLMIEETLSATNFRFVAKIHRKSVLCSDEMSLNRPWTFDRIFVRTFDERSLEQITKFAEFRLHYFCIILLVEKHVGIFNEQAQVSGSGNEWPFSSGKNPTITSLGMRGVPLSDKGQYRFDSGR